VKVKVLTEVINNFHSAKIECRYDPASNTYGVVRLDSDPSMVLYQNGSFKKTTEEEISKQLHAFATHN